MNVVIADVVTDLEAKVEPVPELLAKKIKWLLMVRVPLELQRRLVLEAAESGVSLNWLASNK